MENVKILDEGNSTYQLILYTTKKGNLRYGVQNKNTGVLEAKTDILPLAYKVMLEYTAVLKDQLSQVRMHTEVPYAN